jgi:hypothetical protein
MKHMKNFAMALLVLGTIASCKPSEDDPATGGGVIPNNNVVLQGQLTTRTLKANTKYTLKGLVYIGDQQTVTIPAGTVIFGDKSSKAALIVERGGKLNVEGTASKPVVFTSSAPAGYRNAGDWGGIILCGKGIVNQGVDLVIEGPTDFSAVTGKGLYGGSVSNDNSGSISYCRIEYAGIAYAPNKEINSLTFGGVGSGTNIDHVQASYGGDDSFEWFGGNVNAKYLVAYKGWDDDWDTDFGYSGKVQFGYAVRGASIADQSLSNGFEADNDATGSGATPKSAAIFSNMTNIGPKVNSASISSNFGAGMHLRRNTEQVVANSINLGYKTASVLYDKANGTYKVKHNMLDSTLARSFVAGNGCDTVGMGADNKWTKDYTKVLADVNGTDDNLGFQNATSPALTGASFSDMGLTDAFFTPTTYMGAFGTTPDSGWDWTAGWLNWDPLNKKY